MRMKKLLASLLVAGAALVPAIGQAGDFSGSLSFGYSAQPFTAVQDRGQYVWDGYRYVWVPDQYAPRSYNRDYRDYRGYGRNNPSWSTPYYLGEQEGYGRNRTIVPNPQDNRGGHKSDRD